MKVKLINLKNQKLTANQVLVELTEVNYEDQLFDVKVSAWHEKEGVLTQQYETANFTTLALALFFIDRFEDGNAVEFVKSFDPQP